MPPTAPPGPCPPSDRAGGAISAERRLSAAFRLAFGIGPFEALRGHRLEHARQALEEGAATLKEISFRVGYNHVTNFVAAFRIRFGAPPRQFIEGES